MVTCNNPDLIYELTTGPHSLSPVIFSFQLPVTRRHKSAGEIRVI